MKLRRNSPAFLFICLICSGCATYSLTGVLLESPEVIGPKRMGRFEALGSTSGTTLEATPLMTQPPTPTKSKSDTAEPVAPDPYPLMSKNYFLPFSGISFSLPGELGRDLEIGARLTLGQTLNLKIKYQIYGQTEEKFAPEWSASLLLMPGYTSSSSQEKSYLQIQSGVLIGYRMSDSHLFIITPRLAYGSLSGITVPAPYGVGSQNYSSLIDPSALQYGASVGHQFNLQGFFFRSEIAYLFGSQGQNSLRGIQFGALLGFNIKD